MVGICTSSYTSPYPIEKVGDFPYSYPYPVNAGIPRQNGDGFGQHPRGRVYLPFLNTRAFGFSLLCVSGIRCGRRKKRGAT